MTNAILPEGMASPKDMADAFFDRFDSNRDGKISYEEFKNGAIQEPIIVKLLECDPDPGS